MADERKTHSIGMHPSVDVISEDGYVLTPQKHSFEASGSVTSGHKRSSLASSDLVRSALVDQVNQIDHDVCAAGDEDSFFVADLGQVFRSFQLWKETLPRVQPFYAVKCNTDPHVVLLLGRMGANFDCASKTEIDTVLGLGFTPDRIIYANPCKTNSFIRHACEKNVNLTTVDNANELYKLKRFHPRTRILIRIVTDDESAQCRLSTKFGCTVEVAVNQLLPLCRELDLDVAGVAFHVGSGATCFDSYFHAIKDARRIFDAGEQLGLRLTILDIGGGFEPCSFDAATQVVNRALDTFFPTTYAQQHGMQFIAEPGRFMVANAFTLATHIIARRDLDSNSGMEAMLYINDGVYGNLNCVLFDHQHPEAKVLKHAGKMFPGEKDGDTQSQHYNFSIWGPTCDGLDCVSSKTALSANVGVGDWLYFPELGAYTSAATTSFNGFSGCAKVNYVCSVDLGEYGY